MVASSPDGMQLPPAWRLSADQRKKVLARLDTDEERLTRDAETLRAWVNMQPHLPHLPEQELYLVKAYLHNCKNSMEKAKKGLDTYYTARSAHYDFFGKYNLNEKEMEQYGKFMHVGMSYELTPDLRRVLVVNLTPEEQTEEEFARMCRINLIKADIAMRTDTTLGYELILDVSTFSRNQAKIMALSLNTLKNYLSCTLGALPARVKHLHVVNSSPFFNSTFTLVQPLLKEKIRKRFIIHDNLKSLYSYVSPRHLPKDLGGDLPTCSEMEAALRPFFCSFTDFYAYQRTLRTDESKRPGGPSAMHGESFGCEGSFRKLALD